MQLNAIRIPYMQLESSATIQQWDKHTEITLKEMFFTIPDIIFMTYVMITLLQMMEEKVLA
jgi:hypothetical protein